MPDNVTKDGQPGEGGEAPKTGGPAPAFTLDELNASIRSSVAETVREYMQQDNNPAPVVAQPTVTEINPVEAVIAPILKPHLARLEQASAAASDAAIFYASHPEAAKDKDKIEAAFNNMLSQGTPISRSAIYDWMWGKDREKHIQDAIKDHDAAIARAKEVADGGGSLGTRGQSQTPVDPYSIPHEQLTEQLKDVTF